MRAYVIDDDPVVLQLLVYRVEELGHEVKSFQSSTEALKTVFTDLPEFILVDIMMPQIDGLEFCRRVRANSALDATKVIVVSSKSYEFDRRQAASVGANGYITKPISPDFGQELQAFLVPMAELRYWGVRGTLPVPGKESLRYGGNTSCVSLSLAKDRVFVFDAGTGIRGLGAELAAQGKRLNGHVFISHPHWDHINAFPFFAPLYTPGNEIEVIGAAHGDVTVRQYMGAQMDDIYFPVTMREFGARVNFRDIGEQSFEVEGVAVQSMLLSHPGRCLGYRVDLGRSSLCYVTDNELFPADLPQYDAHYVQRLKYFIQDADILVTDATYLDDAYRKKIGWGHSPVGEVAHLAHEAGVKQLHLFHHDPGETDADIDVKLEVARDILSGLHSDTHCIAPAEGDHFSLPTGMTLAAKTVKTA